MQGEDLALDAAHSLKWENVFSKKTSNTPPSLHGEVAWNHSFNGGSLLTLAP